MYISLARRGLGPFWSFRDSPLRLACHLGLGVPGLSPWGDNDNDDNNNNDVDNHDHNNDNNEINNDNDNSINTTTTTTTTTTTNNNNNNKGVTLAPMCPTCNDAPFLVFRIMTLGFRV